MSSSGAPRISPLVHMALLAVQVMFGTLPVAGKLLLDHLEPLGVVAARTGGACLVFWAVLLLTGRHQKLKRTADFWRLALLSLLGVTINQIFFLLGLKYTSALNASVLITAIPVFTTVLVLLFRFERTGISGITGILVAFLGVAAVTGLDHMDLSSTLFLGNVMIVLNAFSYALFLVLCRSILHVYSPLTVTAWVFTFGALAVMPIGAGALWRGVTGFGPLAWGLLLYIVAVPTVGAYLLNSWSLKRAPSSLVATYIYLQPVTAGLLAALFLGEQLTARLFIGSLTIFIGIYLVGRNRPGAITQPSHRDRR